MSVVGIHSRGLARVLIEESAAAVGPDEWGAGHLSSPLGALSGDRSHEGG